MSDLIHVEHGAAPWQASHDARVIKQYRYYDVPLSGVIEQNGCQYLFKCASRPDEVLTLWWYTDITPDERRMIEDGPAEEFNTRFRKLDLHGWCRIAFATERLGIVDYEDAELTPEGLAEALGKLQDRLDELGRDAHGLTVDLVLT
ncbi:MAG: hypothetical protein KY451_00085 [Actinobacteria bacterium]|nr:hypothetical protein [Actinomycetota bacterium]MBW3648008.1 hypothetical protein [Actinomycetota bacterium]